MASYSVYDVYTPTKPAILTFVERELINDRLVDAIRTPGKQVVVFGHSGSGKTTLLINKLNQTYEDHVTTRCMAGVKFDSLVIDAFDQLDKYYTSELSSKESAKEASSLGGEYLRIKASISEELSLSTSEKKVRLLPVQLTVQRLARFMGEAKCCWVLEDFHKVDASEKVKLSQTMKVFMDMAYEYPSVKIVAIGAVGTAREVVEYDQEMRNRVSEIHVPLMNDDELKEIIVRGASCLNIRFDEITQLRVISYCNGLASVCHQLCLNLCFGAGVVQTVKIETNVNTSCLEGALKRYIEEESDSIKAAFDKALRQRRKRKYDNCRLILESLADTDKDALQAADIFQDVKSKKPGYPYGNITKYLSELQQESRGRIVRYDEQSGGYSFTNPFHKVYMKLLALNLRRRGDSADMKIDFDLSDLSKQLFSIVLGEIKAVRKR